MNKTDTSLEKIRQLFLNDTPLLDVRAEIEFDKAAFPGSVNLPILKTEERHKVGICYKNRGQEEAVRLGHTLVSGNIKEERIVAWCEFLRSNPDAHLYCWRGGMRSNLTKQWMGEVGLDVPLITGGYKALRKVILDEFESAATTVPMIIVAGNTGVAKTQLIRECDNSIDLEGIAHHRGSSFGRRVRSGPTQGHFENRLGIDIIKKRSANPGRPLFLEDEGRTIGPLAVPHNFWSAMGDASIVKVDMPFDFRVNRILQEYVVDMVEEHVTADPVLGFDNFREYLLGGLQRIKKRLGSERHQDLATLMSSALNQQEMTGNVASHEEWIVQLLTEYYDPMYEYQLDMKKDRIVFVGDYDEVLQWCLAQ
jgi:tRNA 2-selenouridine synthase